MSDEAKISNLRELNAQLTEKIARDQRKYEDRIVKLLRERDEWKKLAEALRVQESRITGILSDASTVNTDLPDGVSDLVKQRDEAVEYLRQMVRYLKVAQPEDPGDKYAVTQLLAGYERLHQDWERGVKLRETISK